MTTELSRDINTVSLFLAHSQTDLSKCFPTDCIVLCISQILSQLDHVLTYLSRTPNSAQTLILVGGKGHSTPAIAAAITSHPKWSSLAPKITPDLAESRIAELVQQHFFPSLSTSKTLSILIEDRSTNCGSNAVETRSLLEQRTLASLSSSSVSLPRRCILIQDPTMMRRTLASFEKAFQDTSTEFSCCPVFVPRVISAAICSPSSSASSRRRTATQDLGLKFHGPGVPEAGLWPLPRFLGLLQGEIPRLRDDALGYGPNGKRFIGHVDVPDDVEAAWTRVSAALPGER